MDFCSLAHAGSLYIDQIKHTSMHKETHTRQIVVTYRLLFLGARWQTHECGRLIVVLITDAPTAYDAFGLLGEELRALVAGDVLIACVST